MRLQAVATRLDVLSGGHVSTPIASFLDGGNVGIGNPAPTRILSLDRQNVYMSFNYNGAEKWVIGNENLQSDRFILYNGVTASYALLVSQSNQVGIGPAGIISTAQLGVSSPYAQVITLRGYYGSSVSNNTQLTFHGSAAAADLWVLGTDIVAGNGSQDFVFVNNGGSPNGVTMVLQRTGNVGIGTTSPAQRLTVVGAVQITDNTGAGGGQTLSSGNSTTTGTNYGGVFTATGAGASSNTGVYAQASGATSTNFSLRIPGPAAGAGNYAIYSDATADSLINGRLGIGTTPSARLTVLDPTWQVLRLYGSYGSTTVNNTQIRFWGAAAGGDMWAVGMDTATNNGSTDFHFYNFGGTSTNVTLTLQRGGNVGIGTMSPTSPLTVFGANPQILIGDGSGNNYSIGRDVTLGTLFIKGTQTSFTGYAFFVNSTTQVLTITNSGYVGIGTTGPIAQCHIVGAGTANTYYANGDAVGGTLYVQDTGSGVNNGGQILFGSYFGPSASIKMCVQGGAGPAGDLIFCTRTSSGNVMERMRVNYSGYVGIGGGFSSLNLLSVINPTNQTTVAGANQITVGEVSNNPNYRLNMGFFANGAQWTGAIQSTHNGPTGGILLLQPSGGTVGVGLIAPIAQLHVYGLGTDYNSYTNGDATGATLYLQDSGNTSGNGGQILFGASQGGVAGVFASVKGAVNGNQAAGPTGDIIFCTRGTTGNVTEKMRITYSGLVGIITGQSVTHQLQIAADDAYKTMTSTWAYGSDARIKRNVRDLEGGLSIINRLRPIEAEFNGLGGSVEGQRTVSVIAQEIREVLPGTVSPHRAKLHPEDSEDTELLAFNPHEILFHLILAVKQLSGQLAALKGV
jgi:hypothetical protein